MLIFLSERQNENVTKLMFTANVTWQIHRLRRALKDWTLVSRKRWKDDKEREEAVHFIIDLICELIREDRPGEWKDDNCQACKG